MALTLPLSCTSCGAPAFAARPGSDAVHELFLLQTAEPMRCWCWSCWRKQFAQEEAA